MKRRAAPSVPDIAFLMIAPVYAIFGAVRLTQSDGDLAGHIRMGSWILSNHALPAHSLASYTAATEALVAPAWLSEVVFALLFKAGGLPLIAVVTGLLIGVTHALIALFLRNRGVDPRVVVAAVIATLFLASSHWLARPHMFSITASVLTLILLERRGQGALPAFFILFLVWANLHGGWLYGLLLIAAYAMGELGEGLITPDREAAFSAARSHCLALAAAVAGTLVNPYFLGLHREVFAAVTSASLSSSIDEYMSPNFHELASFPFLIAILSSVALLALSGKRIQLSRLCVILMSLFFALRADRNIALFGVTAVPLLILHAADSRNALRRPFPFLRQFARIDANARVGLWGGPVAAFLLLVGLARGSIGPVRLIADGFDARTFPVAAVRAAEKAGLDGHVFSPWTWGGYLMYAWPGARIHVDPLKFSQQTIDSHTIIEAVRPGWRAELARWDVSLAIVEPGSRLDSALSVEPGWSRWYQDSTAVVLLRHPPAVPPPAGGV
jgi:hypothetical protein